MEAGMHPVCNAGNLCVGIAVRQIDQSEGLPTLAKVIRREIAIGMSQRGKALGARVVVISASSFCTPHAAVACQH